MIDLDELHNNMISYVLVGFTNSGISPIDAVELITRLRQAEKDAERYRWLRDELEQSHGGIALFDGDCHVCDIDLFIDEAMQCNKTGE